MQSCNTPGLSVVVTAADNPDANNVGIKNSGAAPRRRQPERRRKATRLRVEISLVSTRDTTVLTSKRSL